MAQIFSTDIVNQWRTHPQSFDTHIWVHYPKVVLQATIVDISEILPDPTTPDYWVEILVQDVVGDIMDVKYGMTITFSTGPNGVPDLGETFINLDQPNTAPVLRFSRVSRGTHPGELKVVYGMSVTVYEEYKVWAKIPNITTTGIMWKDGFLYVEDNTRYLPPVANGGQPVIKIVPTNTDTYVFNLYGSNSYAVGNGSTITDYLWELPATGVTFFGGSVDTDADIQLEAEPGMYHVYLTVTDNNAKTHRCAVPIIVIAKVLSDPYALLYDYLVPKSLSLREGGNTLTFDVPVDYFYRDSYRPGAMVIMFEDSYVGFDTVAGTQILSSDMVDLEHMNLRFVGWLDEETESISADGQGQTPTTQLTAIDIIGRLNKIPGFPQIVEREFTITTWVSVWALDVAKYYHYLLQWHTTALNIANVFLPDDGTLYPAVSLSSEGSPPYQQVKQLVSSIRHTFRADVTGAIYSRRDPMLYKESERTSDYFMEINDGDISSIDMPFSNWPKNHWLRGAGVSTSTENASTLTGLASYFCIAPGKAPGQGESGTEQSQLLVRNQLELNQIIGNMYARMNSPYGQYSVTLAHTAWIGMDPAYMKWLRVTIAANSATNRGITLNSDRFLINEVNIAFQPEGGYREVTMNLEREVDEMTATTVIPPEVANIPSTVTGNPVNYEVITNSWGEEDTTFIPGHAIIVAVPNIVLLVNNIGGGSLDVVDISPASMPGYPAMGILDPYNYDRLIVLCENGIIACDDIRAVTPTWSTVYTPDTLTYNLAWVIRGSNTREGYFCWSGYAIGAGNYYRFR
jgi:hypothetical protein